MKTKRIVYACAVLVVLFGVHRVDAHYRPDQYLQVEKGLEPVLTDLSTHLNTLETIASQLETHAAGLRDTAQGCAATAAVEILRHHAMRAWYNRLLFQNLSDEAVSLGQMSTVVTLSVKPLKHGIYQLGKIGRDEKTAEPRQAYQQATETMRAMLDLYEESLRLLKAAIRTER